MLYYLRENDPPGYLGGICPHGRPGVCFTCLETANCLTVRAVEAVEWYYRDIEIVFSGKRGFHIHVLDFDPSDWTPRRGKTTRRFHADARYHFALMLQLQTFEWSRSHFTLNVDPCRLVAIPSTLDARTGLVALLIRSRRDLEQRSAYSIAEAADAMRFLPAPFKVTQRAWAR